MDERRRSYIEVDGKGESWRRENRESSEADTGRDGRQGCEARHIVGYDVGTAGAAISISYSVRRLFVGATGFSSQANGKQPSQSFVSIHS
jgi:hypothetical protein